MATNSISSIDASIAKLATSFQTAIKATIEAESQPLNKTKAQKDLLDVRRGIYVDMKNNFDALQSSLQALISTQANFAMNLISKASVVPGTSGATVLSATSKESASVGDYEIAVTHLAKAQTKSTSAAYSVDAALGKSGTFWIGGSGTRSVNLTASDSVIAAATGTVVSGQRELGTGSYTLETRELSGVRQFRLVNADGTAVSISNQDGTGYSSGWQNMRSGSYDTGRGLTLDLSTIGVMSNTSLTYTAAGSSINIGTSDSLRTITAAINAVSQPEGRDFRASIVANKLVLSGVQTGENHSMIFTDNAGLGFGADLQVAQNAKFTVNGMDVSRASHTNLTDVIDGVTLSLAADAEGKTAHLSITASTDKAVTLMKAMVDKFNATVTHLKDKLASIPKTDGEKTTYTRGPLTGDIGISGLRLDILNKMNRNVTNSGSFKNFSEIGLSFDKDMKLTLDSTKFTDAIKTKPSDLKALLDTGLGALNDLVSRNVGTNGFLSNSLTSIDSQRTAYDKRIAKYNDNLALRKEALYTQYMGYQTQLADYGRTAEMFGMFYGTTDTSA